MCLYYGGRIMVNFYREAIARGENFIVEALYISSLVWPKHWGRINKCAQFARYHIKSNITKSHIKAYWNDKWSTYMAHPYQKHEVVTGKWKINLFVNSSTCRMKRYDIEAEEIIKSTTWPLQALSYLEIEKNQASFMKHNHEERK